MRLIFLGAPGAGKGTQAEVVSKTLQIPTISTGNIIREALESGSEWGVKMKSYMEKGALVPDEIVIGIVQDRLSQPDCENGFILDGFPRTIPQAEALDRMEITIDRVVNIDVPDEVIAQRVSGRRVCPNCGNSYHIAYKKPQVEGVCDGCGSTLIQRKDDLPETVKNRLHVYHEQTEPLVEYYEKQGKLFTVKGQGGVEETTKAVLDAVKA